MSRILLIMLLCFPGALLWAQQDVRISPTEVDSANLVDIRPGIVTVGSTILVSWQKLGATRPFMLARWPLTAGGGGELIDSFVPEPLAQIDSGSKYRTMREMAATRIDTLVNLDGVTVLASRFQRLDWGYLDSIDHDSYLGDQWTYYVPSPEGWRIGTRYVRWLVNSTQENPIPTGYFYSSRIKYDPDRRECVVLSQTHLLAFNDTGATWSLSSPYSGSAPWDIVPVGPDSVLALADSVAYLWSSDTLRDSTAFPAYTWGLGLSWGSGIYRLLGPRFLRVTPNYQAGLVHAELFDLMGDSVVAADIVLACRSGELAVAQRASDSVIAIVAGGDGVHATFLTSRLDTIRSNAQVSVSSGMTTRLAATFVGDSLYAVWQDFRNVNADIYGASVAAPHPPALSVPADAAAMPAPGIRVRPSPARDRVAVEVTGAERIDGATIFDLLGRPVLRVDRGAGDPSSFTLDVSTLGAGIYRVVVERRGRGVLSAPLAILR
jgi:hypothetical protein